MSGQPGNGAHVKLARYLADNPSAHLTIEQVVALAGVSRKAAYNAARMLALEGTAEVVMVVRRPQSAKNGGQAV